MLNQKFLIITEIQPNAAQLEHMDSTTGQGIFGVSAKIETLQIILN